MHTPIALTRALSSACSRPVIRPGARYCLMLIIALCAHMASALEVGDVAPDFELAGTDGKIHKLSDYRGTTVVLAWFPKAYTSGCTIECKSLAENGHLIKRYKAAYFMASVDPLEDNAGFASLHNADFPLLSDPQKTTASVYDVLSPSGYSVRHTFYIDPAGIVSAIDTSVRPATSAQDMASQLGKLDTPLQPAMAE